MNHKTSVDGLFEIVQARPRRHATATGRLILICRGGRLFGADPKGRVYFGRLLTQHKRTARLSALQGTYEIPLKRSALRDAPEKDPSIQLSITGDVDPLARFQNATVSVGGRKVDIEITYLGPLPP